MQWVKEIDVLLSWLMDAGKAHMMTGSWQ